MAQQVGKPIRTQQGVEKIGMLRWEDIKSQMLLDAKNFNNYTMTEVCGLQYYEMQLDYRD